MAPAMAPHIYAELLPHIRRMSLVVSLPTPATHFTKAGLTPDGKRAYIYHERVTYEIILPGTSNKKGELLGGLLKEGNLQVSWRIVWDQAEAGKFQEALQDASATGVGLGVIPPWSATELGGGAMVLCRGCGATIVDAGKVECWKDLPSENWAEMMEFWHCHKPADKPAGKENEKPEETDDAVAINGGATNRDATNGDKVEGDKLAARGYGANSVITARKGVGFVDLMTILFSGEDYQGLTYSTSTFEYGCPDEKALESIIWMTKVSGKTVPMHVFCTGCGTQLGTYDLRKSAATLFKWKLNITSYTLIDTAPESVLPSLSHCVAAALAATQAHSGSAKMVLLGDKETLSLWVLNPHLTYSCNTQAKVPAMKILFHSEPSDVEEITLPDAIIKEIRDILTKSSLALPPGERTFAKGNWSVGLLERWEPPKVVSDLPPVSTFITMPGESLI